MSYRRKEIPLDAVQSSPKEIFSRDVRITEVAITDFAGEINLHFGVDADPITIKGPISFKPQGGEQRNGLYFTNDSAQAGVECVLYVSFSGGLDPDLRTG